MEKITESIARECWEAIKDAPESEQSIITASIDGFQKCAMLVRGWTLVPFVYAGGWDYVDSVIDLAGVRHEITCEHVEILDDDGEVERIEYADDATRIFNWYPNAQRTQAVCCGGYRPGYCWAQRGQAALR